MASLFMHLAITSQAAKQLHIEEKSFLVGSLLPDFATIGNSHYRVEESGSDMVTIDLNKACIDFFNEEDTLDLTTLGYYLHLVQDRAFRRFLIEECNISFRNGIKRKLYSDYEALNFYLIKRYNLAYLNEIEDLPDNSMITQMFAPDISSLKLEISKVFGSSNIPHKFRVLDEDKVDKYIETAVELSMHEIESVCHTKEPYEKSSFYWKKKRISALYKMLRKIYRLFTRPVIIIKHKIWK